MLRRIARPLLASVFVLDGLRALARPHEEIEHLPYAEEALDRAAAELPAPVSTDLIVRGLGLAKVGAGVALGFGVAPRVAAGVLALLHTPTMLGRHPFWTQTGAARRESIGGLVRDGAILGGLLLAAGDTAGKPSLAWRADAARTQATKQTKQVTKRAGKQARAAAKHATQSVTASAERDVAKLEASLERTARRASRKARKAARRIEREARSATATVEHAVGDAVTGAKDRANALLPG